MKLKKLLTYDFIRDFSQLLHTEFEKKLFIASLRNYCSYGNPLRFHNFAFSMRELILVIIDRKAPPASVRQACWYQKESEKRDVTRRQQVKFCIQGFLSDSYFDDELLDEWNEVINNFLKDFNFFNTYTHINEKHFEPCPQKFYDDMKKIIQLTKTVLKQLSLQEHIAIESLKKHCNCVIKEYLVENLPEKLSILANNCILEEVSCEEAKIEEAKIKDIDCENISILVEGEINVTQEYGKGEDFTTLNESYPFSVSALFSVKDPKIINIDYSQIEDNIDTSKWYE